MSSYEQERGITISTVGDDVSIGYHASVSDGVIYAGHPSQMSPVCDGDVLTREALDDLHNQLKERRKSNKAKVILIDGAMLGAGKAALMAKLAKENLDVIVCGDSEQTPPKNDGTLKSLCVDELIPPQSDEFVIAMQKAVHEEYHMPIHRGGKGDRVRRRQQFRNGRR